MFATLRNNPPDHLHVRNRLQQQQQQKQQQQHTLELLDGLRTASLQGLVRKLC